MVSGPFPEHDTPALEYAPNDDLDGALLDARDAFPGWDIFHAGHGYLAVTAGATVCMAGDIPGLIDKLRQVKPEA